MGRWNVLLELLQQVLHLVDCNDHELILDQFFLNKPTNLLWLYNINSNHIWMNKHRLSDVQ